MKKMFLLAATALLLTSCSKKSDPGTEEPTKTEPTVLLTKVTNVTPNDRDNGKIQAVFTYNGKQLIKAEVNQQFDGRFAATHFLTYNAQGQLASTAINHYSYNAANFLTSTVSYSGNNVSKILLYKTSGVLGTTNDFTYADGKLTRWFDNSQQEIVYTYNSSGNCTNQVVKEYANAVPNGYVITFDYLTFDNKHSVSSALPYWFYFMANASIAKNCDVPGVNNVVTESPNATYYYEYNSNGYPTKIRRVEGGSENVYTYEYITVN
ncbi:hypothetical protein ACFQ3S_10980 [Mucilaginibacter terrae]|uniref:hypothetical protein n=1 Tax=Mucilaginibacter terrae TaxID=1955052 RepID=UPI00362E6B3E